MPIGEAQLRVVAHKPRKGWLQDCVAGVEPVALARELLGQTPGLDKVPAPEVEAVGFVTDSATTRLVYTAPLSLSALLAIDAEQGDPEWTLLAPWGKTSLDALDDVHAMVLNHWRLAVAETTAAFDLLPNYFTTTQVRALYSSIWGQARDWSNFHRWLHKNNAGICREVAPQKVETEVDKALNSAPHLMAAAAAAGTTANLLSAAIAGATSSGLVGTSPVAVGTLARALPGVRVAAALTGGAIAYQRSVARGKAPAWFTRTHPERRVLQEPYSPRPEWLQQNQLARTLH